MADEQKDRKKQSGPLGLGPLGKKQTKEKEGRIKIIMVGEDGKMLEQPKFEKFSKGGSVKKKKSSAGKAIRGKGCEIR